MKGPQYLIKRWKNITNEKTEENAMDILNKFNIDAYKKGCIMPSHKLTHYGPLKDNEI